MADSACDLNIPEPIIHLGAQDLLKLGGIQQRGWLRKKSNQKLKALSRLSEFVNMKWGQLYVILKGGCLYCFKNESAKSPNTAFTLFGYNKIVRAGDILESERAWVFKLLHVNPTGKTYYFAADCEEDMHIWMIAIKKEMYHANGKTAPQDVRRLPPLGKEIDDDPIYEVTDGGVPTKNCVVVDDDDDGDNEYKDIDEAKITSPNQQYPPPRIPPKNPRISPVGMSVGIKVMPELPQSGTKPGKAQRSNYDNPPPLPKRSTSEGDDNVYHETNDKPRTTSLPGHHRNTIKMPPVDTYEPAVADNEQGEYIELQSDEYWEKIYWHELNTSVTTKETLSKIGVDGVFLVREGAHTKYVLEVWNQTTQKVNKFKIFNNNTMDQFWVVDGSKFETLEELCRNHFTIPLKAGNVQVLLTKPYGLMR